MKFSRYGDGSGIVRPGAAVQEAVLGPAGMLGFLEQRWGIGVPTVAAAVRIGQYLQCVSRADDGRQFYSDSFAADPWESSKTLLSWRDQLVLAGWTGEALLSGSRIAALAQVEAGVGNVLSPGFADRLRTVLNVIRQRPIRLDWLAAVVLMEPKADWEAWWRSIFQALAERGVAVVARDEPVCAAEGDLAVAKAVLFGSGNEDEVFAGDDTVSLVLGQNEAILAKTLAAWLQSGGNDQVVLIAGHRSEWLDRTLKDAGLPGTGVPGASPARSLLQVLSTAWETFWGPPNVDAYLAWLTLPRSPMAYGLRHRLADAMVESPGIGGAPWLAAWQEARARYQNRLLDDPDRTPQQRGRQLAEWDADAKFWCEHAHHDSAVGIPASLLTELVSKVGTWAKRLAHQADGDPVAGDLGAAADVLIEAVRASGHSHVSRTLLGRMWQSVIGDGATRADAPEERAPWQLAAHPGEVTEPCSTVVWWRFEDSMSKVRRPPWSAAELTALADARIMIDSPSEQTRREAQAWSRPFRHAGTRVLLLASRAAADESVSLHPLWDRIRAGASSPRVVDADRLFLIGAGSVGGRSVHLQSREMNRLPEARSLWPLGSQAAPKREMESASSLETLFSCSLRWVLQYAAHIRPMRMMQLPSMQPMIGSLVHAMVHELLTERSYGDADDVESAAATEYDRLVPQLAAPLLEPENGVRRLQTRTESARAIRTLVEWVNQEGLVVAESEVEKTRPWRQGQSIAGRLDLVLADAESRPIVWDLKWSSGKTYVDQLNAGNSIQLATYRWLLGDDPAPRAAYALLKGSHSRLAWEPAGKELAWSQIEDSYDYYRELLATTAHATGVETPEVPIGVLAPKPQCNYCPYGHLCGQRRAEG